MQPCCVCGEPFAPTNRKHRHCSNTCVARTYIRRERIKKLLRQLSYEQLEYIEAVAQLQKEAQQECAT